MLCACLCFENMRQFIVRRKDGSNRVGLMLNSVATFRVNSLQQKKPPGGDCASDVHDWSNHAGTYHQMDSSPA